MALTVLRLKKSITVSSIKDSLNMQRLQPLKNRKTMTNGPSASQPHQMDASSPPIPAATTATHSVSS